jgi:hypothetical protein
MPVVSRRYFRFAGNTDNTRRASSVTSRGIATYHNVFAYNTVVY